VYDTDKAKHQLLAYHRESVRCLIKISDALFASASLDGAIVIWHTSSLSPLKTLTYPEHVRLLVSAQAPAAASSVNAATCINTN